MKPMMSAATWVPPLAENPSICPAACTELSQSVITFTVCHFTSLSVCHFTACEVHLTFTVCLSESICSFRVRSESICSEATWVPPLAENPSICPARCTELSLSVSGSASVGVSNTEGVCRITVCLAFALRGAPRVHSLSFRVHLFSVQSACATSHA